MCLEKILIIIAIILFVVLLLRQANEHLDPSVKYVPVLNLVPAESIGYPVPRIMLTPDGEVETPDPATVTLTKETTVQTTVKKPKMSTREIIVIVIGSVLLIAFIAVGIYAIKSRP